MTEIPTMQFQQKSKKLRGLHALSNPILNLPLTAKVTLTESVVSVNCPAGSIINVQNLQLCNCKHHLFWRHIQGLVNLPPVALLVQSISFKRPWGRSKVPLLPIYRLNCPLQLRTTFSCIWFRARKSCPSWFWSLSLVRKVWGSHVLHF